MFWNKKKVRLIEFIKSVELKTNGYETHYSTRENGCFVSGSYSSIREDGEMFFDKFIELKGLIRSDEVLKQSNL